LIKQVPVLCGYADKSLPMALLTERLHERAKLDGFGPRTENDQNAGFGLLLVGDSATCDGM